MKKFDELPKSVKKAIRFIKQDSTPEQLKDIEIYLQKAITKRNNEFSKESMNGMVKS
jgi:hypothetical protein